MFENPSSAHWRTALLIFVSAGIILGAAPARAWEHEPLAAFQQRREQLARQTADGIVVFYGYEETDVAAATTSFRQNENFYYLTGWNQPDAMMMIIPAKGSSSPPREILFIPPKDKAQERWTGPRLDPKVSDASDVTGFAKVMSTAEFAARLQKALKRFHKIYTELTPQPESGEECFQKDEVADLHKLAPAAELADLRPLVTRMRMVKSAGEIALIRKAVHASVDAQLAAMKAVRLGMWEYQAAALIKYTFENEGCEWPSYPPIVGAGFNSTVLHYDDDSSQMHAGDVVVIDAAGSYSGYASDITRTLPVDGHYTPRQLEIYNVVLGAQRAAITAARPGAYVSGDHHPESLNQVARDYINSHGRDLQGGRLGKYFIHGLSHPVGLNVHDPFIPNQPLEPGMVITIEPGIYIPREKIGVRIEDMILITPGGSEVLTRRLPKDPQAVEQIMAAAAK
ncbi:MAG TPA: Xaa-Pro peptidase family protein [Terriglobia bacterium]|nr:Xaa-Pro peptidase family protein [Terriglobia bacterium]